MVVVVVLVAFQFFSYLREFTFAWGTWYEQIPNRIIIAISVSLLSPPQWIRFHGLFMYHLVRGNQCWCMLCNIGINLFGWIMTIYGYAIARARARAHTHTHTHVTALCPGLPAWASTRKLTPIWILLKQETVSGSGISWAICKSAPRSRQITMPAPHRSVFYRMDALPVAQPTASKHWRHIGYAIAM